MANAKARLASRPGPTIVQRTVRTIMRTVSWVVLAWIGFIAVRLIVTAAATHPAFSLAGWLLGLAISLPIGAVEVAAVATAVAAMLIVPYAYVVWPQPERRFWGEDLAWPRAALAALGAGAVLGIVTSLVLRLAGGSH